MQPKLAARPGVITAAFLTLLMLVLVACGTPQAPPTLQQQHTATSTPRAISTSVAYRPAPAAPRTPTPTTVPIKSRDAAMPTRSAVSEGQPGRAMPEPTQLAPKPIRPTPRPKRVSPETKKRTPVAQPLPAKPDAQRDRPERHKAQVKPERPQQPVHRKLRVPKPAPESKLRLSIEGWTTYVYASRDGQRRVVVAEETRWMPGMFEAYVRLSPDNRMLTYAKSVSSPTTDRMQLYAVNVDGTGRKLLADLPWELWVASPVWSPDSRRIAYVRTRSPDEKPGLELWIVDADGSNHRKLLSHPSFRAEIFYGPERHPLRWNEHGDLQYLDPEKDKLWTVEIETGQLSSQELTARPSKVNIPVIETVHPIPIQSQNDPRWRYDQMAPSQSNTLGSFGCALTSASMAFGAHGVGTNPERLNRDMGDHSANFYWAYASNNFSRGKLRIEDAIWTFDWDRVDGALQRGSPAIVWLADRGAYTTSETLLTHWVLVVGGSGQTPGGYRIYDPWDGTTYKTLAYYTDKGYHPRRVYAYVQR